MHTNLELYTTSHCHLCEEAEALLVQVGEELSFNYNKIEISNNEDLLTTYGTKIPVLRNMSTQQELCWPFDKQSIYQLIGEI